MNRSHWTHTVLNGLDPALVEEASAPAPKRPVRLRPAIVLAACLCLLLLGTALASEGFTTFPTFRLVQDGTIEGGQRIRRSGWEVLVETRPIPLSAFSRQARTLPEGQDDRLMQGFDSLAEAEDFLGLDLLDNPMLDSATPMLGFSMVMEDGSDQPVYALLSRNWSEEKELASASLAAAFRLEEEGEHETVLHVNISLRTEAADNSHEVATASFNRLNTSFRTEEYTTPSGLMAMIVEATELWGEEDRVDYIANFSYRGAAVRIQAFCPDDQKSALTTLKVLLNAFQ